MAFVPKTDWQPNDTVYSKDVNRWEQGIYDASFVFSSDGTKKYKWGIDGNGIVYLEEV